MDRTELRGKVFPFLPLLVPFLAFFSLLAPLMAQPDAGRDPIRVRFGVDEACLSGVKPVDAKIAFTLWIEEAMKQLALEARVESSFLGSRAEMVRALRTGQIDLILLNAVHFVPVATEVDMDPLAVISATTKVGREYQLLVPREVSLDEIGRKGQGRLLVHRGAGGELPLIWLRHAFRGRGWADPGQVFREVDMPRKPSSCVIPVFFGQGRACVITRSDAETLYELNPQLRSSLHPVLRSEPIVETLICQTPAFAARLDAQLSRSHVEGADRRLVEAFDTGRGRGVLLEVLTSIHLYPAGRQLMLLFRVQRNLPYREEDMAATRKLLEGLP